MVTPVPPSTTKIKYCEDFSTSQRSSLFNVVILHRKRSLVGRAGMLCVAVVVSHLLLLFFLSGILIILYNIRVSSRMEQDAPRGTTTTTTTTTTVTIIICMMCECIV